MDTLALINNIVNVTFNYCVELLFLIADLFGITYEMINFIIFVIGMPAIILTQFFYIIFLVGKRSKTQLK
jgi:hypothetical protein